MRKNGPDEGMLLQNINPVVAPVEMGSPESSVASSDGSGRSFTSRDRPSLPLPLWFLFALNGFITAFPMTGLLYIVNTRVEMSLSLLPVYGAVAFLPSSFRPIYAYFSQTNKRDRLFSFLLLLNAASFGMTALIPRHGVVLCFIAAFVRGVTMAWPEFLLGLTLIDVARLQPNFDATCAHFQAQAATARNIGSLVASVGALLLIMASNSTLEAGTMDLLFYVSASANVFGAGLGIYDRTGRQAVHHTTPESSNHGPSYASISTADVEAGTTSLLPSAKSLLCRCTCSHNVVLVLLLQGAVVMFALQQPLEYIFTKDGWKVLASISMLALIGAFVSATWSGQMKYSQKVGLFLILRHLTPSASYIMSSYLYDIFVSTPHLLQIMTLLDSGIATVSTWSYGKLFSRFSSDTAIPLLIVALTILSSVVSLAQIWLIHVLSILKRSHWLQFVVVVVVQGVGNILGTWCFLPSVIVATTSIKHSHEDRRRSNSFPVSAFDGASNATDGSETEDFDDEESVEVSASDDGMAPEETSQERNGRNMQYGSLISCIDFGDQLAALILGVLVRNLNVSRENNWDNLETLIQVCALAGICSTVFVLILRK
jgi:hypothetical protein